VSRFHAATWFRNTPRSLPITLKPEPGNSRWRPASHQGPCSTSSWRSAGAAANAAATLAEALGTILGRALRTGDQDASQILEETAVKA
jgi:anti-sigma-K factor RskA